MYLRSTEYSLLRIPYLGVFYSGNHGYPVYRIFFIITDDQSIGPIQERASVSSHDRVDFLASNATRWISRRESSGAAHLWLLLFPWVGAQASLCKA